MIDDLYLAKIIKNENDGKLPIGEIIGYGVDS